MTGRTPASGRPTWSAVLLALAFAGGCAASYEDAPRSETEPSAAERERGDVLLEDEMAPAEATPTAAPEAEPDFDQIQRELAANNAKLRELGVALGGELDNETQVEQAKEDRNEKGGDGLRSTSTSSTGAGKAATAKPGAAPPSDSKRDKKPQKQKKTESKAKDVGGAELDDVAPAPAPKPDPAKAAPLTPNAGAQGQAVGRCEQICELATISCELGEQICELADRHPAEEDYASACERANLDCEAAKEACDVCTE